MKKLKRFAILSTLTILAFGAKAQDSRTDNHAITIVVPNVALLDLETSVAKDFTASFTHSGEAGDKLTAPSSNTDLWLNYSSILPATGVTARRVDVKASTTIAGLDIAVVAGAITTGAGTRGTPGSAVTLTTSDQQLITGIGSAYTVSGASKGHQLTYTFTALDANYANIRSTTGTPVTVTYTLVDY